MLSGPLYARSHHHLCCLKAIINLFVLAWTSTTTTTTHCLSLSKTKQQACFLLQEAFLNYLPLSLINLEFWSTGTSSCCEFRNFCVFIDGYLKPCLWVSLKSIFAHFSALRNVCSASPIKGEVAIPQDQGGPSSVSLPHPWGLAAARLPTETTSESPRTAQQLNRN